LLCGCFMGLTIILTMVIAVLYYGKYTRTKTTITNHILPNNSPNSDTVVTQEESEYEFTTAKDYSKSYIPVYRYNSRAPIHNSFSDPVDRRTILKHFTSNGGYYPAS
ncbi:unnamed protein product, partial [Didymodactylos carnosus]